LTDAPAALCLGYAETAMEMTSEQAIHEATSELLRALNTSDLEAVMAVWDDRGTPMPSGHASVQGHQAIGAYFDELFRHHRFEFVFTSSQVSVEGALAVERVVYSATVWSLERGRSQRDRGKGVHVYRQREDGSWKLVIDVWNTDGPEPSSGAEGS
jgi:ketosteroid isomerase-like protein